MLSLTVAFDVRSSVVPRSQLVCTVTLQHVPAPELLLRQALAVLGALASRPLVLVFYAV